MKPLSLNLSKMKKVGGDEKSSTFLHPSGHRMVIAHHAVSALQRKQLEKLPVEHLADGTPDAPVESPVRQNDWDYMKSELLPDNDPKKLAQAHEDAMASLPKTPGDVTPEPTPAPVETPEPERTPAAVPMVPAPQAAQPTQAAPSGLAVQGYRQELGGIQNQANAASQLAKSQAAIEAQKIKDDQAFNDTAQKNLQFLMDQQQKVINDIQNSHINPSHYMESMDADKKVGTAIALFLGGFGSGFTHQGNPAENFINKQIDRDIAAQESELGNKKTMLGAYQQMFGNKQVALDFARANQTSLYSHRVLQAAAENGTPQAMALAQVESGKLKMASDQFLQQAAMKATVLGTVQKGNLDPARELYLKHTAGMIDKSQYEQGNKEVAQAQEMEKLRAGLHQSFKDLDQKAFAGKFSPADRDSAINTYAGRLAKLSEGRFNLDESKLQIGAILPSALESKETRAKKLVRLDDLINGQVNTPTLDGMGIKRPQAMMMDPLEGKTASNAKGEKLIRKNGSWVPHGR